MKQKFCQSCAMPMTDELRASDEYCTYCFKDGKFIDPNITMEQMLQIGLKGIDESPEMNKFMKFFIKKMYPSQLKKLKRWS